MNTSPHGATSSASTQVEPYVGPVESFKDFVGAFKLLYENYSASGYCGQNPSGMHIPPFALHPDTVVFIARDPINQDVTATLSVIPDSPIGLPMDSVFKDVVDEMRSTKRKLVEVGMLADRRSDNQTSANWHQLAMDRLGYLADFFKRVTDYFWSLSKDDDLCITVNPRHAPFYRRYLGFQVVAKDRVCHSVNGHPAVLLKLDMRKASPKQVQHGRFKELLDQPQTPIDQLQPKYHPTPDELKFLLASCPESDEPAATIRRLAEQSAMDGVPLADIVRKHIENLCRKDA